LSLHDRYVRPNICVQYFKHNQFRSLTVTINLQAKRGHVFIDKLEGVKGATKNNKAKDRQCNDLKIKDKKTTMVNTTLQRKLKIEPSEHQ
jgi:hypothetical protein